MTVSIVLHAVLVAATLHPVAARDPLVVAVFAPQAAEHELREGLNAYDAGDYATALVHFERAYALHPDPDYLYAWAQAARGAGDCRRAIELYGRFLATEPTGVTLQAAQQNLARCAEQLATASPEPIAEPDPEPVVEREDAVGLDTGEPTRRPPDRLGLGLLVPGTVALAAGTALVAVAGARQAAQARQTTYQGFHDLDVGIDRLYVAGAVTLGVGLALTLAGAIRLAVRSRRRSASGALVTPGFQIRGTPMVSFQVSGLRDLSRRRRGGRSSDR